MTFSSWRDVHDKYYEREIPILIKGNIVTCNTIQDAINFGKVSDWMLMHDVIQCYGDDGNYSITVPVFLTGVVSLVIACVLGRRETANGNGEGI